MDGPSAPLLPLVLTGLGMAAAGVLLVWLARRGRDGRLPRNQFARVRTMLTLGTAVWMVGWVLRGAAAAQRAARAAVEGRH
ncbi:hypothetical protein [Microbacterium lushaniae]|uniref:Uncharacterized protein n=1 Tax=Microbacterium lushaniae TaxID=2614639 RepID=A0A5J6L283_9MICO|nr:hypothetical protein [Microbacterium lushaniae]QEW02557.1 hypothetical protein F6J85_05195 [Microbacterium lushaniae]